MRFSLKTLLVVMLCLACWLGGYASARFWYQQQLGHLRQTGITKADLDDVEARLNRTLDKPR